MGSFWNRHAGPATPVAHGVAGPSQGAAPAPAPAPPADLAARASASSGGSPPGRLGQLPPPSKSVRQIASDAADVLRIMRRRPLASMVGLAMDARDLLGRGVDRPVEADPQRALALLQDPAHAGSLQTPPIYVRPAEQDGIDPQAFELGSRRAAEGERVPLSRELDPDRRYLWAMTAPNAPGEAPGIHLGTERPVTDAKGRVDKLGHPAILNTSLGRGGRHQAVFAGELSHQGGRWVIDNNSGRWFGGNAAQLKQLGLHKRDLLAAAAHQINDMSDLDIRHAKQFSGNPLRFVEQLIGAHETKDLPLPSQPPIRRP